MKIKPELRQDFNKRFGNKNVEYVIFYFDKNENVFNALDHFSLSNEDKEVQKEIMDLCSIINNCRDSFHALYNAYNDYFKYVSSDPSGQEENEVFIQSIRLCNEFIDSGKMFLDFMQNNWGKKNLEEHDYSEWDAQRRETYDSKLAYRICYNLRNLIEHPGNKIIFCGPAIDWNNLPIINLSLSKSIIFSDKKNAKNFLKKVDKPDSYWNDDANLSINQYLPEYMKALMKLYKLAMSYFISGNLKRIGDLAKYCGKGSLNLNLWSVSVKYKDFIENGDLNSPWKEEVTGHTLNKTLSSLEEDNILRINYIKIDPE